MNGLQKQIPRITVQLGVSLLTLASCSQNAGEFSGTQFANTSASASSAQISKYNVNIHPVNKVVCDPFNGQVGSTPDKGVSANLYYESGGQSHLNSALNFPTQAMASTHTLFFNDLNVPTRMFYQGFATPTGSFVTDDSGNKLIEYFGLQFNTVLKLTPDQASGTYEFASLSDDGEVVQAQIGGVWQTIINNDGDHPTRMGCATQLLTINQGDEIPLKISYYQGPRYHIAHVFMWRPSSTYGKDSLCGQLGNSLFFDPNNNSVPLQPYQDLLSRGWTPVSADNFYIPASQSYNPCVQGTPPVISGLTLLPSSSEESFTFTWQTDIASTSQIMLTNVKTGAQILSTADNTLVTAHSVTVTGLQFSTTYTVNAVSISGDLGKTVSADLTFTTP